MSKRPEWWLYVLAKIWPITWKSARATQWPLVGGLVAKTALPLMSEKNFNVTHIPINKTIAGPQSTYLPERVLEELIERSAHRVIIKRCTCRDERKCDNHSIELGCIQLGAGTEEIDPRIAHHVSIEEAIKHMHRCVEDGLVPMVGRVKVDNLIWGVRDRGRLLAVCFCCSCCCTVLNSGKYLPEEVAKRIVRLKGLKLTTDHQKCTRCRTCVESCFMDALSIENGRISRDNQRCKGCGLCASLCPEKAILTSVDSVDDAIEELQGRIRQRIDYESNFQTNEEQGMTSNKTFWIMLMTGSIGLWALSVVGGQLLFPENPLKAWGLFLVLIVIHASELPGTFRLGRELGLSPQRMLIKTMLYGFTWWVPLKKGIFDR